MTKHVKIVSMYIDICIYLLYYNMFMYYMYVYDVCVYIFSNKAYRSGQMAARKRKAEVQDEPPELQTVTYTTQRVLGKGSFGVVYQAQVLETGETVAIKSVKMQEKDREAPLIH